MEIWLFVTREGKRSSAGLRARLYSECKTREWTFVPLETKPAQLGNGRTVEILSANDATALYKRIHRMPLAVLSTGGAEVCLRPDENDRTRVYFLRGLARFCRYKAFFVHNVQLDPPDLSWMDDCAEWEKQVNCDDERDPRCLPLHVFAAKEGIDETLETSDGREAFNGHHGHGGNRADIQATTWKLNAIGHGQESLRIAGKQLGTGMHWDVSPDRGPRTIHTTSETWEVREYLNIYPDTHVRASKSSHARRLFPKT